MSLNCSYKDVEWSECFADKNEKTVCDADMIIPDAKNDIAKVISISADASAPSIEYSSGRVTVSGSVKFNVLYITDEENPKVCSVTKSSLYTHVSLCGSDEENVVCLAVPTIVSTGFDTVNSRRIRASCEISLAISCFKNLRRSLLTKAEGAECITRELTLPSMKAILTRQVSVNETADLPAGKNPIDEILRSSVTVSGYETKTLHNKVIVKGSILVSLLYLSGIEINNASVEFPFTEVVDAEGVSSSSDSDIKVLVSESDITPETDLSGEYKMINAALVLAVVIKASSEEKVGVVTDTYLPHGAVKTEKLDITLRALAPSVIEEEFVKGSLSLPVPHAPISRIFDVSCRLSEPKIEEGLLTASAEVTVLYISSDPASPLSSFSGRIPLTHRLSSNDISSARISPEHVNYAIVSSEELEIRINVSILSSSSSAEKITVFTSAEEDSYTAPKRASVIISYVTEGDTVWSVAKKHNIKRADLLCANALSETDALKSGDRLIIPR